MRAIWDRSDEFFYDGFDPATIVNIRAGLSAETKIAFWDYEVVAAEKFGYVASAKPRMNPDAGIGVACGIDAGAYVAGIAQLRIDKATGNVKVERVVVAQDMGVIVNPVGAMQQLEGCVTQGLGYVFTEEVRFKNGEVLDKNFTSYTLPRFSWVPKIEGHLVENNAIPPQGGGEPAIVLMGAMVGNAICDATGVRMTQLPFTPSRVKDGLKG